MTSEQRLNAFIKLGDFLNKPSEEIQGLIENAKFSNAWFTPENTKSALTSVAQMLNRADLAKWFEMEKPALEFENLQIIGLVLAGNIPLVGFHDILCVLASGNKALIKLSSQDNKLVPFILSKLVEFEPAFKDRISYTERLENFDAVIATGSNNSSRYFEYYFSKVPNIIRKNRNSVAVILGHENADQLAKLGNDIFSYFGLGCRNVSKIYFPKGYNLATFFEAIESFQPIINHHKYNNNYDYNKSIFLVNGQKHFDNGFLLLKEDKALTSALATLNFEYYDNLDDLKIDLAAADNEIQCIATESDLNLPRQVAFGDTQKPKLWDYADDVNTMAFLAT